MWWENHIVLIQNIDTWHAQSRNASKCMFLKKFSDRCPMIFLGFPMFKSHESVHVPPTRFIRTIPSSRMIPNRSHSTNAVLQLPCFAHLVLEQVVRHVFVGDASRQGAIGQKKKTEAKIFGKTEYWMYWLYWHIKMNIIQWRNPWILLNVYRRHWNHQLGQVFFQARTGPVDGSKLRLNLL